MNDRPDASGERMSDIQSYSPINISEIDTSKFFFTAVNAAKRRGMLSEAELRYVDTQIDILLHDALKSSHKSYVRRETAKELLEGVFRVLDCAYSHDVGGITEIIDSIKVRKLDEYALKGKRACAAWLNNAMNRVYHIEHIMYKRRDLRMDFILEIKSELLYTDIYRAGGESTSALLSALCLAPPATLECVSQGMDLLCAAFDLAAYYNAKEVLAAAARSGITAGGDVYYNKGFVTALTVSALVSAFLREDSVYVPKEGMFEVEDMLLEMTDAELREFFLDCIRIFVNRKSIDTDEVNKVSTEIERLYAFTVHDGGINPYVIAEECVMFVREHIKERGNFEKYLFVK